MENFSLLENGIFIGNIKSISSNLKNQNINVVVSVLSETEYENCMLSHTIKEENIEWHQLVIEDDKNANISQYFYTVHKIITKAVNENKNVIVHCLGCISRSPTLVAAYLMIENKWTVEEALGHLKKKRPQINPNIGFLKQLKELEYTLFNS